MNIIEETEKIIQSACEEYKQSAEDGYDYWNEHIKYVYEEAIKLAQKYNADEEIVRLGALLHDIALVKKVGDRKDHHINGKLLADEVLTSFSYPEDKKQKVLGCVLHHRSSKNAENVEEQCVADADVLAHFDNIPMLFNSAFNRSNLNLNEVRPWMKDCFEKDFNDLSERTKVEFKERYNLICDVVLNISNADNK
jgi:uncharacterized protein